ncbi:DUF4440 domain-containing protein [Pseudomonas aeruginosa]|nr:DUF4440 domain-containing protein [Pseudomonas aeruginosa]RUE67857.1 DUF4440 domain-containing protein [Pseudomonas aeruginosa]TEB74136.1 DUF4440 domain-containing protein [Pseudomonas aeruginosa]TEC18953.1 DUF4440 domain-containing protein [Pseudomonas aeruginosa]
MRDLLGGRESPRYSTAVFPRIPDERFKALRGVARSHWSGASWTSRGRGYCRSEGPPDDQGKSIPAHAGVPRHNQESAMSSEVSAIRQLIEDWRAAVRASDVPRIVSYYAEDIVAFDAILQLQFKGRDAYQKHWQACTEMCKGPMTFDIAELQIHADQQVAFAHYLCHCGGTGPDGKPHSSWMRVSAGYRKQGDGWKVIHEHFSAPFDMDGKALFDLQP